MANELRTDFIFNVGDSDRRIDLTRKNLFALNNDFNNLGKNLSLSQTIGKQVKDSDRLMQAAQTDIRRYQQQTLKGAAEKEAAENLKKQLEYQKAISENLQKLREIAEKEGFKGIETLITIKDDTAAGVKSELKPAASSKDTKRAYSFFDQYENQ